MNVWKSNDGMSTWERLPATGLQGLGFAFPSQVLVSPEYPEDDTVYVHVVFGNNPGLYRSTDGGTTFTNVAPLASSGATYRALSPFLTDVESVPPPLGDGRDAFAYATPAASPAILTPPLHRPVAGAPDATDMFLVPRSFPDAAALALVRTAAPDSSPTAPLPQVEAYGCDAAFTCATKLHDFPAGFELNGGGVTSDGVYFIVLRDFQDYRKFEVWRATADGSFEPWTSLNRVLPAVSPDDPVFAPAVSVVGGDSGRFYARASYTPRSGRAGPPADQIFESLDGGQTWRRRSFGRTYTQAGRPGTIPWGRRMGPAHARGDLYMPSPDRLVVIAESMRADRSTYTGIFCSFDRGRTWAEGCAARL